MNYTRKEQIANGLDIPPLTESERLTKALAGAGGSGLPDYSEASVDDVLTIAEKYEDVKTEHVLAEPQTISFIDGQAVSTNFNFNDAPLFNEDYVFDPPTVVSGDRELQNVELELPFKINGREYIFTGYCEYGEFRLTASDSDNNVSYTITGIAGRGYLSFAPNEQTTADYTISCTVTSTESVPSGVEPKWSAPSAGGGVMVVNITSDDVEGQTVYSADKTFAEIAAAVEAGRDVVARMLYNSNDFDQYSMFQYLNAPDEKYAIWGSVLLRRETTPSGTAIYNYLVKIQSDGVADTVEVTTTETWVAD